MTKYEDTIERHLQEIERRLRTLETAPRAAYTSITDDNGDELVRLSRDGLIFLNPATAAEIARLDGDGFHMRDDDGEVRARIGDLGGGHYGLLILDDDGSTQRLEVDERGFLSPYFTVPLVDADTDFKAVTSGSFVATHRAQFEIITHQGLYCWVTALADVGTTGEVRLRNITEDTTTDAVAIPSGGGGTVTQFRWLHGSDLSAGPVFFEVQARRTSGTGALNVYRAPGMTMADPGLCVADGVA